MENKQELSKGRTDEVAGKAKDASYKNPGIFQPKASDAKHDGSRALPRFKCAWLNS